MLSQCVPLYVSLHVVDYSSPCMWSTLMTGSLCIIISLNHIIDSLSFPCLEPHLVYHCSKLSSSMVSRDCKFNNTICSILNVSHDFFGCYQCLHDSSSWRKISKADCYGVEWLIITYMPDCKYNIIKLLFGRTAFRVTIL